MGAKQEYLASEWWPDHSKGPIDLWRRRDDELAAFSRAGLDWQTVDPADLSWQLDGRELAPVDAATAERFVRACRGVHDVPDIDAGPGGIHFVVADTFDLAARAGLLVSGTLRFGVIRTGETLYSATTAEPVPVLAVEFPTPRDQATGRLTLLIDRAYAELLEPGRVPRAVRLTRTVTSR